MSTVDLAAVIAHLRVEADLVSEEVKAVLARAEALAEQHIGRSLADIVEESDGELPRNLESAILLMCATLFDVRVSQPHGVSGIDLSNPFTSAVEALLLPFRSPGVW